MAVKDIKFMNGEVYILKDQTLSLSECESQMAAIDYKKIYEKYNVFKDEEGVEKTNFPYVVYSFYSFVFNSNKLPMPHELLQVYYDMYSDVISLQGDFITYKGKSFRKVDLDARILRTYPSLVRDFHFYLMLVESKLFEKVIYSCKDDVESGKDIVVIHNNTRYTISLFLETKRGAAFKDIKNAYRHKYENEVKMPLKIKSAQQCGDFFAYTDSHVKQLYDALNTPFDDSNEKVVNI